MILLDTDVMIDLLRQYPPAVAWLESLMEEEMFLPGFVVMELIQGCRNKSEQKKLERALSAYAIAWPTPEICAEALFVFSRYYLKHRLGILDALIGQMAVSLGVPLCTFNQKHYAVIPNLKTLQPYEKRL
ncbi:type II toxin-antitoxin system VapC family toxin [Candidatus Acetothermia bacterium]|jgi:predicted nucleic acid-binding protein|nr:type II toxin-antitoxin system VapC family toxin [Candidatus Acetothermia bacterium]MCI2431119.1 type II toxin-antitoxin system VapC family toxin [Candidatus Acetothermia bacterium]